LDRRPVVAVAEVAADATMSTALTSPTIRLTGTPMLVRSAIEREKRSGAAVVRVCRGLTVPGLWANHYGQGFSAEACSQKLLDGRQPGGSDS
jgi:hypothetical protein